MKKSTNRLDTNRTIESILATKKGDFTPSELQLLNQYSGYGGVKNSGIADSRILYEYYTEDSLVAKMWALAYHYAKDSIGSVLEPSCGIGRFFKYAPSNAKLVGYDISEFACEITRAHYPSTEKRLVEIHHASFESLFFNKNTSVAQQVISLSEQNKGFDLVIGNPPYGKFEGRYAGLGEKKLTNAESYDEYFISRGLDVLNRNGILVMVIGAALQNGGTLFLDRPTSKVKEAIARKGKLLDAYRLPQGSFINTDVCTEIVVFQKN